jgi:hypothetical protein
MTSTQTRPNLTPVLTRNGRIKTANAGATKQGKPRSIKECACGRYVVWVQNNADKWYLANCYEYASDNASEKAYYFRKDSPHKCEPAKAGSTINEQIKQDRRRTEMTRWLNERNEQGIETSAEDVAIFLLALASQNND